MGKFDFEVRSACLATKEKLPDRLLAVGKRNLQDDSFVFYLIEILLPVAQSQKVKKALLSTFESYPVNTTAESWLESILDEINRALNKLSENGENFWIGKINTILGIVSTHNIDIAQSGNISGYIFRNGKISSLTENVDLKSDPHPLRTFSDIISGQLTNGDKIIFGNSELYNHLSLDRIRRTTQALSAKESTLELCKYLKKMRVDNVNTIIIETDSKKEEGTDLTSELPEIIYLDQPDETLLCIIGKKMAPHVKNSYENSKKLYGTVKKHTAKHSKVLLEKAKKNWKESTGPKTKEFLSSSGKETSKLFQNVKKSIGPQVTKLQESQQFKKIKLKTKIYTNKTPALGRHVTAIQHVISRWITFLSQKESRKYLYLILILIFLSIGYGKIRSNNINKDKILQEQQIANSYDEANTLFNTAKEDYALGKSNDTIKFSEALAIAKKGEEKIATKEKAIALSREIQEYIDKVSKMTRFYSDKLSSTPFSAPVNKIIAVGNEIYGIDTEGKIYIATPSNKESRLAASIGKENGEATQLTYSEAENIIYIYTSTNKLLNYDVKTKNSTELTISDADGKWEKAQSIATFLNNIYLLDSESGAVWKHPQASGSYGKGVPYVDPKKVPALKNSVSLAIDGNVYVLDKDGNVVKLSKNGKDDFSLKNIPAPNSKITEPKKLVTSEEATYLYVLDKNSNRIIKFSKTGDFVAQYTIDGKNIDDFVINDKIKKIWILSEGTIYELNL